MNYTDQVSNAFISGFDKAYDKATSKRDKLQQLMHRADEDLKARDHQKYMMERKAEIDKEASGVAMKQALVTTRDMGNILGDQQMAAQDKTALLRNKLQELNRVGLASNIDIDTVTVDPENSEYITWNDLDGQQQRATCPAFVGDGGLESYYRAKFTPAGMNPYAQPGGKGGGHSSGDVTSDEQLLNVLNEAERVLDAYGDDTERDIIERNWEYNRYSPEAERLATLGSQLKGMIFKKFGYRNEAEFKNIKSISPEQSVEANMAIIDQYRRLLNAPNKPGGPSPYGALPRYDHTSLRMSKMPEWLLDPTNF